jgi:hypothetical protein
MLCGGIETRVIFEVKLAPDQFSASEIEFH